jgi:phosphonopyruvate decarboxylase
MIDEAAFLAALEANGVSFFAGVPDSLLQPFCAHLASTVPAEQHVIAANEGAAVGLAAGYYLATGALGCVYMQNSGLGNAVNPLASLMDAEVYGIPALLLIGWRGEITGSGQVADEPQHVKQGRITLPLLDCLEIPHALLEAETSDPAGLVGRLVGEARARSAPVALVVRKGTFAGDRALRPGGLASEPTQPSPSLTRQPLTPQPLARQSLARQSLAREDALKAVAAALPDHAVVVGTTGKASRELYEIRRAAGVAPDRDFLCVGSMGHALQIASGIALARPDKTVACIDGDGAMIMHMGGMTTSATLPNLLHIVINNGAHESVGGQPTRGFAIDMPALARACGYGTAWRVDDRAEIAGAIAKALAGGRSAFLEIRTTATSRPDLGRPAAAPRDAMRGFMRSLGTPQDASPRRT